MPVHQGPPGLNPTGQLLVFSFDSSGNLKVAVTGAGSGGTSSVDESTFVAGTSAGTPLMGAVNPSDTPPNGDLAIAALDGARNLKVNIAAGTITVSPPASTTTANQSQKSVGTTTTTLLAQNTSAKRRIVQNTGTTIIYLGFGFVPTASVYSVALPACGVAGDGSSQPWNDTLWQGQINAISSTAGGTVVVSENT
jgi:hypothetical protein